MRTAGERTAETSRHSSGGWQTALVFGFSYYCLTSSIVVLGVTFGAAFLSPPLGERDAALAPIQRCAQSAGRYYLAIARDGYWYRSDEPSVIVCFPAYPVVGALLATATGLSPAWALVALSHASFALAFVLLVRYVQVTRPGASIDLREYSLLSMGLFPGGLFFRCAYSESLFMFLALLAMYGMKQRWPLSVLGIIIGAASGARPVGIVLLAPLVAHIWRESPTAASRGARLLIYCTLACWGLFGFMVFQYIAFDDAIAFARNQEFQWRLRPRPALASHFWALATLEPLRTVFDAGSACFWARVDAVANPFFSIQAANPFVFLLAVLLTLIGVRNGWLTRMEALLVAGLLLVPYATVGHKMGMRAMSRFVSVAFPLHIAAAEVYHRIPPALTVVCFVYQAVLLATYAALFSAGYGCNRQPATSEVVNLPAFREI